MVEDASIYTGKKPHLDTIDYILFSLLFCVFAAIGFYHAWRDRKQKNTDNFQLGNRNMHPIPVSMSLSATFMSPLTILGTPSEIYTHGTMYMWIIVAMLIATAGAAHIFLPIFSKLDKVSCFYYLQLRFGTTLRVLGCLAFLLQTLVYMGFVLYAPSLAIETVTGISLWGTMIGVAALCTISTALGGMKTVLWTQTIQLSLLIAGLLCVLVLGSDSTDGFSNAWNIADYEGRIKFCDLDFDPKVRHSVWTVAIGGSFLLMYLYGVNQAQVQKSLSLPSLKMSQIALWLNFPGTALIIILMCFIGVVMFAFYHSCHPVKAGLIDRNDQLLPLFVLDVIGKYRGLAGIFLACIFSGSLNTLSSGLNAMSAIVLEDFVKPITGKETITKRGIMLSRMIVLVVGCIQFGVAYVISLSDGLVLQFSLTMFSILAGPIFGIFIAGMFFPWTNQIGATVGFIISTGFMCWLGIGNKIEKPTIIEAGLSMHSNGCNWNYSKSASVSEMTSIPTTFKSTIPSTTAAATSVDESLLWDFYRLSYLWYTGIGMIICVIISLTVSFMSGHTKPETLDSRLMCPFIERIFPCLPDFIKEPLRFGVDYSKPSKHAIEAGFSNGGFETNIDLDNSGFETNIGVASYGFERNDVFDNSGNSLQNEDDITIKD